MHHCHNNLLGTTIKFVGRAPVFAGERAEFKIAVGNDAAAARFEIELKYREHTAGPVDVADGATEVAAASALPTRAPRLGRPRALPSRDALSRALVPRLDVGAHGHALPRVSAPAPIPAGRCPTARAAASAADRTPATTTSRACAPAAPGDPPQRIAWKAYARNDHAAAQGVLERHGRAVPARLGPAAGARRRAAARAARALVPRRGRRGPQPRASLAGQRRPARARAEASRRVPRGAGACSSGRRDDGSRYAAAPRRELSLETKRLLWTAAIVVGASLPHWPTLAAWMPVLLLTAIALAVRRSSSYRWPAAAAPAATRCSRSARSAPCCSQYRTLNGVEAGSALARRDGRAEIPRVDATNATSSC